MILVLGYFASDGLDMICCHRLIEVGFRPFCLSTCTFVVCTHGGVCSVCVTCNWWVKSSFLDSTVFGCAFSFADDQINHRSYHPTPLETYLNLVISVVE